jgi:hypothetical protein
VVWRTATHVFHNAQDIITYLEELTGDNQLAAIEHLRRDLVRVTIQNDLLLHDIFEWLVNRGPGVNLRQADNREAWRPIREVYLRVRNRRQEGEANLSGEDKWCTTEFWEQVMRPLTGGGKDVTDVLKQIRAQGISPIEALRRGCYVMFRRLNGEIKARTRREQHCTAGDLREGNISNSSDNRLDQERLDVSGVAAGLHLDRHGFLWHLPPATSIDGVIQAQQERDEAYAGEQATRKRPTRGQKQGSQEAAPENTTPEPDNGPASRLRKKTGRSMAEVLSPDGSTRGRQTPPAKKPKVDVPSPGAQEVASMDSVYSKLNVISTKTERKRATSLKQQGKLESEALSPSRMTIPVKNPSSTQKALWEVIEKRVKGIHDRKVVNISHEAAQIMNLPPSRLVPEIQAIAEGLATASGSDDSLLAYTQCLLDSLRAQIVTRSGFTDEMRELRQIVVQWRRRFRDLNVTLIEGSMWEGGVQLDYLDVESLLIDDMHTGELNGDLIYAMLTITEDNYHVIPPEAFRNYMDHGNRREDMFDTGNRSRNLVIPVYTTGHWSLLIVDRDQGVFYYMDSYENPDRRQRVVASIRAFLSAHPGYNTIPWIESQRRSPQQRNDYDCGVWTIQNAWGWRESRWPTQVGLPDRLQIGRAIWDTAVIEAANRIPPPSDEVEIVGMRNLRMTSVAPPSARQSISTTAQTPTGPTAAQRQQLRNTARRALQIGNTPGPSIRATSVARSGQTTPQLNRMIDDLTPVPSTEHRPTPPRPTGSPLRPATLPPVPQQGLRAASEGIRTTERGSPAPRSTARAQSIQPGQQGQVRPPQQQRQPPPAIAPSTQPQETPSRPQQRTPARRQSELQRLQGPLGHQSQEDPTRQLRSGKRH